MAPLPLWERAAGVLQAGRRTADSAHMAAAAGSQHVGPGCSGHAAKAWPALMHCLSRWQAFGCRTHPTARRRGSGAVDLQAYTASDNIKPNRRPSEGWRSGPKRKNASNAKMLGGWKSGIKAAHRKRGSNRTGCHGQLEKQAGIARSRRTCSVEIWQSRGAEGGRPGQPAVLSA